jgi:hypothetical protein
MTAPYTSPTSPPTPAGRAPSRRDLALSRPLPAREPWEVVGPDFFEAWGYPRGEFQPEHLAIYGQTGRGKSYFEKYVLVERARLRKSRIVVVATKPADKTLVSTGWPIIEDWPPPHGWTKKQTDYDQVIFWAKAPGLGVEGQQKQAQKIVDLLEQLWVPDSNRIVVFDEIAYIEKELGLANYTSRYLREGRGLGITVVATTQRPAQVSRYMHSETAWSVFFAPKDEEDAERMAQVAGNKTYYMRALSELNAADYEFLLVHNLTQESVITSLPKNPIPVTIPNPSRESPKRHPPVS